MNRMGVSFCAALNIFEERDASFILYMVISVDVTLCT